jgi:hypothetical protein
MDTVEKKVSTKKLVVIDTKKLVATSFEGTYKCGEAHLPNPNDDDEFTAAEITAQLNGFREAADGAYYRAKAEEERLAALGKKLTDATKEYEGWFDRLVPEEEQDTFGL